MKRKFILLFFVACSAHLSAGENEIFHIGNKDNLFTEFARGDHEDRIVVYRIGSSSPQKDWPSYHPGEFDRIVSRSTMQQDWTEIRPQRAPRAYKVEFDLDKKPTGTFILHLNAIFRYRRPAPPRYSVLINGRNGASYRLKPRPAPELWWPNGGEAEGNTQYFGYQSLDMPLPASFFRRGANSISLECVDGFGIYYDSLSLSNLASKQPPTVVAAAVESTPFYKNGSSGLVELATVTVQTTRALGTIEIKAVIGSSVIHKSLTQAQAGDIETTIEVPATDKSLPVSLYVSGRSVPVYHGCFIPQRRWKVYALPSEQADFGYNDVPARTLEWENRFIDKTLEIQSAYSDYSFTLDSAANLESYLYTRDERNGKQILNYLHSGKWGINALYTNFFTGLATPEELYQTLNYSLQMGKKYGFAVDSASQTDEPSVTWALPQILADVGIKYFTNGSDPIRGALNPIGLLNLHSPFYWETPTGSKILVWYGISYTAVDDMTWAGWDPESAQSGRYTPSIFGLSRSLPLFLAQYAREDFPFDAVLLFGLHNDEIPMRHSGDADIIQQWNRAYAYPKIIPATQRDFFTYITSHFAGYIKSYRGDGGAYWEDEAGADARIAALTRSAQTQLVAAEKFESIAGWLRAQLKFDRQSFEAAWKNILLADCYVWSDANSFRRPDSDRTHSGEAAHRAWAESALQQTSDLLLTAMDKIAELVESNQQGAVVFNPDNWSRDDFFDFELEPNQILVDPSNGQPISCGVIKSFNDYQKVKCWATGVPATGYKFYPVAIGRVPKGEALSLDSVNPAIENQYYRIEVDLKTGAVLHLIDKTTGRELVNSDSGYLLNEYLYVTGGDPGRFLSGNPKDNRILAADATLPVPSLEVDRSRLTSKPAAVRFSWGTLLRLPSAITQNRPMVIT